MSYDDWVGQLVAWGFSDTEIGNLTVLEISALAAKLAWFDKEIRPSQIKSE